MANAIIGQVTRARLLEAPPGFVKRPRRRGARANGIRYEFKALDHLQALLVGLDWQFLRSPWIEFFDADGHAKYCQPDAVLIPASNPFGIIVEVKLRHTPEAFFQLWRLYLPVLEVLFPRSRWACLEMVQWFDPTTNFPEKIQRTKSPLEISDPKLTAVHIWNPAYERKRQAAGQAAV